MAGSSIGWREVPYAHVPYPLDGSGSRVETLPPIEHERGRHEVWLLGGLKTSGDVMRGEETEVLGLLADPGLSRHRAACLLVLPGTHSKHVTVREDAVRDFTTYMTGELFADLQEVGILRHSIARSSAAGEPALEEQPALEEALRLGARHSLTRGLSGALFQVRTNALLGGMDPLRNRWFLSGVLLGAEARDAIERSPPGLPIVLAAGKAFSRAYAVAFETVGGGDRLVTVAPEIVESSVPRGQAVVLDGWKGKGTA
jgi:2-dehydro-3-deoxygalactonokinase